jgi:chemotaxis family two-component system sensor kinase Cph1
LVPETEKRVIEWNIADLPKVTADRTLLRQVFANLVSNAVKYSGPRSPAIIEIGSEDRDQEILFFVRDNGVGFDMNYADKLFSVFQRLHRNEEFEGTGIGLANIRKIVARHNGRTWAESVLGQGATFYFTLPKA